MNRLLQLSLASLALAVSGSSAFAQATIDQNKALAGNITPGDAPGFPISINHPGHYKLTGNLQVPLGVDGIVINSPGVTLDLNGFSVIAPGYCTLQPNPEMVMCSGGAASRGITGYGGTVLRNGFVRGFNTAGVELNANSSKGNIVQGVHVSHISGRAMVLDEGIVIDSHVEWSVRGIKVIEGIVRGTRVARVGSEFDSEPAIKASLIENSAVHSSLAPAFAGAVRDSLVGYAKGGVGAIYSLGGNYTIGGSKF